MGKLDGKVAVITGGASGMGAGTVRRFVGEGARVVVADVTDERGRALTAELGAAAVMRTPTYRAKRTSPAPSL
jgi:3alpha(or 20beta)-hydroxysteroid dehydrogenase